VFNFHDSSFEYYSLLQYCVHHFLFHGDPSTNVFKLSLEYYSEIDDVHLIDSITDSVTNTPSIFTTIEVLTIYVDCVVMKLPQLSVRSSFTIFSTFVSYPLRLQLLIFLPLNTCTSLIVNLSMNRKTLLIHFKNVSI